jgi:hypothetical protein
MGIEVTKCTRSLRLKVKSEAYGWLNAAAVEVNHVCAPSDGYHSRRRS